MQPPGGLADESSVESGRGQISSSMRGGRGEVLAVIVAATVWGSVFLDRFGPLYIVAEITRDYNVDVAQGGDLSFAIGIGFALAAVLAILLADRLPGNRRTLVVGVAAAGLLSILSAFAPSWSGFALMRGLTALAAGVLAPAITGVIYATAPPSRLGRDIGIVQSANRLTSGLLAPIIYATVAAWVSWRQSVLVGGVLLILAAFMAWFALPADDVAARRPVLKESRARMPRPARASVAISAVMAVSLLTWLVVFSQSAIRLLSSWKDLDLQQAGLLASWFGVGGIIAAVAIPTLSDRIGRGAATIVSGVVGGGAGVALAVSAAMELTWMPVVPVLLLAGSALGALPMAISLVPAEAVGGVGIARALAVPIVTGELIGAALLPALGSYLAGDSTPRLVVVVGVAGGQVLVLGLLTGLALRASHDRQFWIRSRMK